MSITRALVIEADPELAARKAAEARAARYVGVRPDQEGGAWLTGKLDVLDAQLFNAMADRLADILLSRDDYEGTKQVLRAKAAGIMGNPALALALLQEAAQPELSVAQPRDDARGCASDLAPQAPPELRDVPPPPEPDFEGPDTEPVDPMTHQFLPTWLLDCPPDANLEAPPLDAGTPAPEGALDDSTDRLTAHAGHLCGRVELPPEKLLPQVSLIVHIADPTAQALDGVARIEGFGAAHFPALLTELQHAKVSVRPVIDLNQIPGVDRYEIPSAIREAVIQRDLYEPFPGSTKQSRHLDQDHLDRWVDHRSTRGAAGQHCAGCKAGRRASGGAASIRGAAAGGGPRAAATQRCVPPPQTRIENLAPLSRRLHRAKTAGLWQVRRDGVDLVWTSPTGRQHRVLGDGRSPRGPDS